MNWCEPSRAAGLNRLSAFVPHAGHDYASTRNADHGPGHRNNVSQLSPYLRHRLITEREVVAATLASHRYSASEKFVQEVLWRTYWKGWLEMRPDIWRRFLADRTLAMEGATDTVLLAKARAGGTGIAGFDDWAQELVQTGYLHNHARMWFASIWIFTLRLPWALGADFFLQHLLDADPASNTLSWRWVAGLQTAGKTYLATADNIARYTDGRFAPQGLATEAVPLVEPPVPAAATLCNADQYDGSPSLLLVTAEDMHPESLVPQSAHVRSILVSTGGAYGTKSAAFLTQAANDCADRSAAHFGAPAAIIGGLDPDSILAAADAAQVEQVVTPYAPVGPVADDLAVLAGALRHAKVKLIRPRRAWDDQFWPHAKKGFFPFKERMVDLLRDDGLQ